MTLHNGLECFQIAFKRCKTTILLLLIIIIIIITVVLECALFTFVACLHFCVFIFLFTQLNCNFFYSKNLHFAPFTNFAPFINVYL